jgi:PIN domain nuclease of toxin-antitoxin system
VIVLDTHTWIWHAAAPKRLSRAARSTIDRASAIGVSTMSCWEVALLEGTGRLRLDRGVRAWVAAALADDRITALPVSLNIALSAAASSALRDPVDRIIYATAVAHDATLVSRDSRIQEHDPKRVIW